jgi:hypothetical protein
MEDSTQGVEWISPDKDTGCIEGRKEKMTLNTSWTRAAKA